MEKELIVFFGTDDLEKNKQFYCEILDLKIYKDQKYCLIYEINNKSKIGFCNHMKKNAFEKSPIITFVVENVDYFYDTLIKKGMKIDSPQYNDKFKIYHFFFEDPDGYTIEVQKFME
jgi:catechol 2,3-dioxygenase-like lactoylglutathione lyase family enzyme